MIAQKLSVLWNVPVFVENRDGASGTLAGRIVAKLPPDGSTLLMANFSSHCGAAVLNPNIGYNVKRDFTAIELIGISPCVLVCREDNKIKTFDHVVKLCKDEPGKVSFGSVGVGSIQHLTLEMFNLRTNVETLHIPYKGSGPMMADLVGGQISYSWENMASVAQYVKQGKLIALAQASNKRFKQFADTPTTQELGYPGFEAATWYGLMGPPNMAPWLVQRINDDINKVMAMPEVVTMLDNLSAAGGGGPPKKFADFIDEDLVRWGKVVKDAKVVI
jgi:tripartite-type tricarboxylate transporter receptor subunit TctC